MVHEDSLIGRTGVRHFKAPPPLVGVYSEAASGGGGPGKPGHCLQGLRNVLQKETEKCWLSLETGKLLFGIRACRIPQSALCTGSAVTSDGGL